MNRNIDDKTVQGFGEEWDTFNHHDVSTDTFNTIFSEYFSVMPSEIFNGKSVGFDFGCGSGRWARIIAPKVGKLHCIDASEKALLVAKEGLSEHKNCEFHYSSSNELPLADNSCDFGFSLGVLHHIPSTKDAMAECVKKLKPGAPFLVYLYYAFDNKPWWFKLIWKTSEIVRTVLSKMPFKLRLLFSQIIAALIYFPLSRTALLFNKMGVDTSNFPLNYYRDKPFYIQRTDALDRFGTRLEQRFTRQEITQMMEFSGLSEIVFSDNMPFWCAVGTKD
mgnify:CR=1 FL=1